MAAAVFLSACGSTKIPDTIVEDTIIADKDGNITAYIVRDFDKEYYSLTELTDMAREEVSDYNSQKSEEAVKLQSMDMLAENAEQVEAVYTYASYADYNNFNEGNVYYGLVGSVSDGIIPNSAFEDKPDLDSVKSVKDGSSAVIGELEDKHILITDESAIIYCPYTPAYISDNAVLLEDGSVDAKDADGAVIIIFNK
jgi:hypothetical protein